MHHFGVVGGLAVHVHLQVAHFHHVAGNANASLDVIGFQVAGIGWLTGLPGRVVKHHHVVVLHAGKTGQAELRQLNPLEVGRDFGAPDFLVRERDLQGRLDGARAVVHLAHEEEITHQQTPFHRGGGDGESFEQQPADEGGGHHRENDGVQPLAGFGFGSDRLSGSGRLFLGSFGFQ